MGEKDLTVGELTVNIKADTAAFKEAVAEATVAIEALDAALAKLHQTAIEVTVE